MISEEQRRRNNEIARAHYWRHRERNLARTKLWQSKNKDKVEANQKKWRLANADKHRLAAVAWRASNEDRRKSYAKSYNDQHRDERGEYVKAWYKAHPERVLAMSAKKRADRFNATPKWADRDAIERIYAKSIEVSALTGKKHDVDHIWPLNGVGFRGLHVPWNLQIILSSENAKKSNRRPDAVAA